jgi:ribosome maturation factor RimP
LTAITLQDRLHAIIAPIVAAMGLELVRIQLSGQAGSLTLQVMAEDPATGQLTIDQCAKLSRALDAPLDEADPIDGEYALEVSSPGIDRPLTRRKDWEAWTGHEVRLKLESKLDGRARAHGDIAGLDGDDVLITERSGGTLRLPLAAIESAKLVLTNRLIAAARPLDASGADEIIEEAVPANNNEDDMESANPDSGLED